MTLTGLFENILALMTTRTPAETHVWASLEGVHRVSKRMAAVRRTAATLAAATSSFGILPPSCHRATMLPRMGLWSSTRNVWLRQFRAYCRGEQPSH